MSWQEFSAASDPRAGGVRVAALRALMTAQGVDAVIVPRADAYGGEYVADADARLRWLTGFSGSAGFAVVTAARAGVFIDGRYRVQVLADVDPDVFTPVPWPETSASSWLKGALPQGGVLGYDPWLHTRAEIEALEKGLAGSGIALRPIPNPVDAIWTDRPDPPKGAARLHDAALAGATSAERRGLIASVLGQAGQGAVVLTAPDSIAWLLNIRGADIPRNPVVQAFATIDAAGRVGLYADPAKFDAQVRAHLGSEVTIAPPDRFLPALAALDGPVRVDADSAPEAVFRALKEAGLTIARDRDPVALPKARKTPAELAGMRAAHRRDAVAMIRPSPRAIMPGMTPWTRPQALTTRVIRKSCCAFHGTSSKLWAME